MIKEKSGVKSWAANNQKLKKGNSLIVFIDEDVLKKWHCEEKKVKGGNKLYSDLAITLCIQLRQFFKLGLRQTEDLMNSLLALMKINMLAPDYTTLSRRMSSLKIKLPRFDEGKNTILMIDSSGLKMYKSGEGAARKRGYDSHKMWRKLHIVIDGETQIVQECALTPKSVDDAEMTKCLLENGTCCISGK